MEEQLRKLINEFDIRETGNKFLDEQYRETILDVLIDFIKLELYKAKGGVYSEMIKEFEMLKEEDLVNKGLILGVLRDGLTKLTTKYMEKKKEKMVLNIDPMKSMEEAKIIVKVIEDLIKKNQDRDILVNFKQVDGSDNVYAGFTIEEKDSK